MELIAQEPITSIWSIRPTTPMRCRSCWKRRSRCRWCGDTGGYDRVDTLRALEGKIDIYLPDLKYVDSAPAVYPAPDYRETAKTAILEMFRQTGPCRYGEDGLLKRGRHHPPSGAARPAGSSQKVMDWVSEQFRPGEVLFSLMSQYIPCGHAADFAEIDRPLRRGGGRKAGGIYGFAGAGGLHTGADLTSEAVYSAV